MANPGSNPPIPAAAFDADAYVNAVSILEQLCFAKEECDRVIDRNDQVPEPFTPSEDCIKAVPSDWADVPTHKKLWVQSWLQGVGTWGTFEVEKAFRMWQRHSGSQLIPSVQELRAYGYGLKFFEPCFEEAMERERLLAILRQPNTALAQYLVQHHDFWQNPRNVNRIDEVQEYFEGMSRDDLQRQVRPAALLAQLERDRAVDATSEQSADPFPCLKLVDPCVHQRGDLKVELITTPKELVEASRLLKNCGASYLQKAAEGKRFLLVLKKAEKLVAMAEWDPSQKGFVQMVESCNKRIRDEWKEIFSESEKRLPTKFTIRFRRRPLMNFIYLSHSSCEALGKITKLNVGYVDSSLFLDSIFHLTESDFASLSPGLTELMSLLDMIRRYPQAAFEEAEFLADVALANQDMEFVKRLCNIGAQDYSGLLLQACQLACPLEMISALIQTGGGINHHKDSKGRTGLP